MTQAKRVLESYYVRDNTLLGVAIRICEVGQHLLCVSDEYSTFGIGKQACCSMHAMYFFISSTYTRLQGSRDLCRRSVCVVDLYVRNIIIRQRVRHHRPSSMRVDTLDHHRSAQINPSHSDLHIGPCLTIVLLKPYGNGYIYAFS